MVLGYDLGHQSIHRRQVARAQRKLIFPLFLQKHIQHFPSRSLNLLMRERNVTGFPAPPQGR